MFRFVVASLLVVLVSWGRPGLAQTDPMWRSPWTLSMGAGVIPAKASGHRCIEDETMGNTCPDDPTFTVWSSGFTFDIAVPFAFWLSKGGHWALELGPQLVIDVWTPDTSWFVLNEPYYGPSYGVAVACTIGAAFGVRVRPHAPPVPASHKGSFESAFWLVTGVGPGSYGLYGRVSAELWTGWSLPRRWQPPLEHWQRPRPEWRRAWLVGPYVRGALYGYPAERTLTSAQVDVGLRVEIRHETSMPQPVP